MESSGLYTVIVADDEDELREAVCSLIPWEETGFRLVGSAGNGLDALELAEKLQPDLLLSDIHMPFISGTSLAGQVRELQPLISIAFLSGYDDFEYAKLGIDYGVIAYLLKPISMAELTAALREIKAKMDAQLNYFAAPADMGGELHLTVASLLLDGQADTASEEELLRLLSSAGFVATAPYRLTVLATRLSPADIALRRAAQMFDRLLCRFFSCCSIASGGRVLSLLVSENGFDRLGIALDELQQAVKKVFGTQCTIGVSRETDTLTECHSACREAVDAQRFAEEAGICRMSELLRPDSEPSAVTADMTPKLEELMYGSSRGELEQYLSAVLPAADGETFAGRMAALRVLVEAERLLSRALPTEELSLLMRRAGLSGGAELEEDTRTLRRRTLDLCLSGQDALRRCRNDGVRRLCVETLRIIESEYMDEALSLGAVSGRLHVSPNYLSASMKKYAGDTFINLLIKKRMETAQALLCTGNMKIAEVARRCGYSDQHYFSFCFKKYYGVSPIKMRRSEGKEGGA